MRLILKSEFIRNEMIVFTKGQCHGLQYFFFVNSILSSECIYIIPHNNPNRSQACYLWLL